MNHMLEAYNYHNDPRTRARDGNDWYNSFDSDAMTVTVTVYDNDNGDEVTRTLPAQYVVCPLCEGKGSHVNPSIDCGGISRDDFYDDPDFERGYFSGRYDVTCYQCHGKRVVPTINRAACHGPEAVTLKLLEEEWAEEAEFEACCRAERMFGC